VNNCDLCAEAPAIRTFDTRDEVVTEVAEKVRACMVCGVFIDTKNKTALFARVRHRYVDYKAAIRAVASLFQTVVKKEEVPT